MPPAPRVSREPPRPDPAGSTATFRRPGGAAMIRSPLMSSTVRAGAVATALGAPGRAVVGEGRAAAAVTAVVAMTSPTVTAGSTGRRFLMPSPSQPADRPRSISKLCPDTAMGSRADGPLLGGGPDDHASFRV